MKVAEPSTGDETNQAQDDVAKVVGEKLKQLCPSLKPPQPPTAASRQRDVRWQVRIPDARNRLEYYLRVDFTTAKSEVSITASAWCNGRVIYETPRATLTQSALPNWLDSELAECSRKYEIDRYPLAKVEIQPEIA